MTVTNKTLKREVEDLILEQIYVLKQAAAMTDRDIFDFHLRHYEIVMLFRRMDHGKRVGDDSRRGWLS
jgi:hypothetical protein